MFNQSCHCIGNVRAADSEKGDCVRAVGYISRLLELRSQHAVYWYPMDHIASHDNPKLKYLKKLQQKKHRDAEHCFVIENPLTIRDGLALGAIPIELYVTPDFIERSADIYTRLTERVTPEHSYTVEERALKSVSALEHPQGIAAVYAIPETAIDMHQSVVVLLGVSDPGNVGTIMRTAAAFGITQVALDLESADPYSPKVISAAKEAIFAVTTARQEQAGIGAIHKRLPLYGLDVGGTQSVDEVAWQQPCGMVFGSEAHGIPDALRGHIDTFVSIPMSGAVESLNVAASAAIVLCRAFVVGQR